MKPEILPYNRALDGLRALAVMLVLAAHFPAVEGIQLSYFLKAAASGLRVGYLGVDLFFVLSGYLITSILIRERQLGVYSFSRFYKKRALRIFPIFYLSLIFVFFFFDISSAELLGNAFYVSNYYYSVVPDPSPLRHTWSLSVEEQFYLFWPLVVAFCPLNKITRVILIGLVSAFVFTIIIAASYFEPDTYSRFVIRALPFRMMSLGIGAYIALRPEVAAAVPVRYSVIAIAACPILVLSLYGQEGLHAPVLQLFIMSFWSVSIFLLVFNGGNNRLPVITHLFEWQPFVYVGRISYGIYLYHYVVLFGMGILVTHASFSVSAAQFLIALAATFAISSLSFHVIERPFLRMKRLVAASG